MAASWRQMLSSGLLLVLALLWIGATTFSVEYGTRHSWLFWVEHWTGDWRTMFLSDRPRGQHRKIAIVSVNEDTVAQYPYRTPIDRGLVARLVTALDNAGVEAIGIDFLFLKATEPRKEQELVSAIKAAKARVVIAVGDNRVELTDQQKAYQAEFLKASGAKAGYANLLTGSDRIVRFIAPPEDPEFPKSLAVATAKPSAAPADGPRRISWLLRPKNGNERFTILPAHLMAAPDGLPAPPTAAALSALLKGKIVFIGADLIGLDRHETPLASWENDDEMPGVLIHAQVAAQLIDNRKIKRVNSDVLVAIYAFLAMVGMWIGLRFGSAGYGLYFTTTTLIIAVIDIGLFVSLRQFLPFSACLAALAIGLAGGILLRRLLPWASTISR
ncbi:MAG: CHASE2 domain-containing protein [Pseudomonadota bacterium]